LEQSRSSSRPQALAAAVLLLIAIALASGAAVVAVGDGCSIRVRKGELGASRRRYGVWRVQGGDDLKRTPKPVQQGQAGAR